MTVKNGKLANQTVFNDGFLSRKEDSGTVAKVTLANPESATILDTQKFIGEIADTVGLTEGDAAGKDYSSTNYIADGDSHKVAIEKLDNQSKVTADALAALDAREALNDSAQQLEIDDHQARLLAAEATIVDHETRIDALEPVVAAHTIELADHETRIDNLETVTVDHETRIDNLETTATDHENRVDALELLTTQHTASINDHETRLDNLETADMSIGGNKTFTGNVIIGGNLTVQGNLTSVNSQNLEVVDQNITVNKSGNDASSENAGITVERTTANAGVLFDSSLVSKWKIGIVGAFYEVVVSGVAQAISGVKNFVSGIKTDFINESTLDSGVNVDGVLIKDGLVDGRDVSSDGTNLDAHFVAADPHPQYLLQSEGDSLYDANGAAAAAIAAHEAALNPHPQYLTTVEADAAYDANGAAASVQDNLTDHEAALDPHPQYLNAAEANAAYDANGAAQAVQDNLDTHSNQTNPHGTSAADIGLDQVTNHAQLRIEAGHFNLYSRKLAPVGDDIILIEDSEDSFSKAKVKISDLGISSGGGGGGLLRFTINGNYGAITVPTNYVDGFFISSQPIIIKQVIMFNQAAGTSGTTELDIKVKPQGSGVWASIFTTTPKISSGAGSDIWVGSGQVIPNTVAPSLSLPLTIPAYTALRFDIIQKQAGNPTDCGLILVL